MFRKHEILIDKEPLGNTMHRPLGDYISAELSVISSVIHFFIIVLVIQNKNLRRVQAHRLLLNLSIGHALTGATNFIGTFVSRDLSTITYAWYVYANISLLALTLDRSFSIFSPFRYQTIRDSVKIGFMGFSPFCCLIYVLKMLFSPAKTEKIANNEGSMKFFIFGMSAEMAILVVANSLIFIAVRRQLRKINVSKSTTTTHTRNMPSRKDIARFYVCFGCVITYVLLWLPAMFVKVLQFYGGVVVDHKYFSLSIAVANINPLSDAFLLLYFNRELKRVLKDIMKMNVPLTRTSTVA